MKRDNLFFRVVVWLLLIALFTMVAMLVWFVVWDGNQSTDSLKWLQFIQTVGTFLLPPLLCAWWWSADHRPFRWLKMDRAASSQQFVLAAMIMVCALPAINLLADLNSKIELPESLGFIEQILKQQEEAAALLTERFLHADNVWVLLINLGLMAVLPALAEELSFRGVLQQLLSGNSKRVHLAIWLTAFVFSAIHMQFYGFIPRMLMGALFGYVFVWTGSLWVPIMMHFINNGIAVFSYYALSVSGQDIHSMDSIGSGAMWWLGVVSLVVVGVLLCVLHRCRSKEVLNF